MRIKICIVLYVLTSVMQCAKLPADFKTCKQSDSNIINCLKVAVQDALRKMATGIPDLKIFPLEPLVAQNVTISAGKGPVKVAQKYWDMQIHNLTASRVEKMEASLTEPIKFRTELFTSEFILKANYDFDGHIMQLPMIGKGKCTVNLYDVKSVLGFTAEKFNKKGKTYMRLLEFTVLIRPSKVHFNFENLFNGDERAGKNLNAVMNDNWKEIFQDVGSGYEEFMASIGKHISNLIFTKVPFVDVFPL